MKIRKIMAGLFILVVLVVGLVAVFMPLKTTDFALDTVISIDIKGMNRFKTRKLLNESFKLIDRYEQTFSRTISGSVVSQLNTGETVTVSNEVLALIQSAKNYAALSQGAFDVTIMPLVDLWAIKTTQTQVPLEVDIKAALKRVGHQNIEITGHDVKLLNGAQIDLGAIAKGYIADRVKAYLTEQGCVSAIINLGGNVVAIGTKDDGGAWAVGVQMPFSEQGEMAGVIHVVDQSVVTSGSYERYFIKDGNVYHHIIDPKTGYPAENELNAVTVICANSADADALSTACFVLGVEKGRALLESIEGVDGVFITKSGEIITTSGMDDRGTFTPIS